MTLDAQLKEELTREYEDYMARVRLMSKDEILSRVNLIGDMTDTYYFLTSDDCAFDDDEASYLLSVNNPLELITEHWRDNDKDISESISHTLWEVCDRELGDDEDEDEYE